MFVYVAVFLCLLPEVTNAQQKEILSLREKIEATYVPMDISPCCVNRQTTCEQRGEECTNYIKPPYLLWTCRCEVTIQKELQRFSQQCMRKAIELAEERIRNEATRVIIRHHPGQGGSGFQGKKANAGAKGPGGRAKVPLSEEFFRQRQAAAAAAAQG